MTHVPNTSLSIQICNGYQTGLISKIIEMHMDFYSVHSGFGQKFESVLGQGLADFVTRLNEPANDVWLAKQHGRIVGSIAIDGQDLGPDCAHLRWFITHPDVRGSGLGHALLGRAIDFVDQLGFAETHLWTFAGLDAAKHLYTEHGFECVEEFEGDQWGKLVLEQRFVRRKP